MSSKDFLLSDPAVAVPFLEEPDVSPLRFAAPVSVLVVLLPPEVDNCPPEVALAFDPDADVVVEFTPPTGTGTEVVLVDPLSIDVTLAGFGFESAGAVPFDGAVVFPVETVEFPFFSVERSELTADLLSVTDAILFSSGLVAS